jgi:hypothetical protein
MEDAIFLWIVIIGIATGSTWLVVSALELIQRVDCTDLPQNADRSTTPGEERS